MTGISDGYFLVCSDVIILWSLKKITHYNSSIHRLKSFPTGSRFTKQFILYKRSL